MLEIEKWRKQCKSESVSRKERSNLDNAYTMPEDFGTFDSTDESSTDLVPITFASFDYMADDSLNKGTFHEKITLNPEDDMSAELCGNFTFR